MIKPITIQIDTQSIEKSKQQSITGGICFDFGDYQFPEKGWNDFIVIILDWWLIALEKIILNQESNEELLFMDGPLHVNIRRLDKKLCILECIDRRKAEPVYSNKYSIISLIKAVLDVAKTVDCVCTEKKWYTNDTESLKTTIKRIKNYSFT